MAYASASDVAALTKNIVGADGEFTESSCPTLTQVDVWLSTGCSLINARLAQAGYDPIPSSSGAYDLAKQVNACYAAWFAERSRTSARSNPGERTRSDLLKDDFKFLLEMLMELDLSMLGVSQFSNSAQPYAGGISDSDKTTVQTDTDRVRPRFGRGMFRNPDRGGDAGSNS